MEFDLVVTASLGDDLHEIRSKILRLPHGNGYNKHWNSTGSREVFGLSDGTLKHQGRLVPGAIALSHHEQLDRLREGCPDALPLAFLAGDPCHDRLLASLPHILHYRRALLPHPERTLITINSTWKHESLFGIDPSYIPEIIAELPHDEFQVALILHPNVWAAHGRRQIESWLAEALRSGLLLIPPAEGWRAAVVAADHVISDHGSVGVYAAALGKPVLLAPEGRAAVDPRSGLGRLYATALPLDRNAPLRPQLAKATELRADTRAVAETWVSSAPGASLDLIRAQAYRMMGTAPPPGRPPRLAVPVPEIRRGGPGSLWTAVEPCPDEPGVLRVRRTPAAVLPQGPGDAVLVCSDDEPDHRLAAAADVFTAARDRLPAAAGRWSDTVFAHRPGTRITAVHEPDGVELRTRGGDVFALRFDPPLPNDHHLAASVLAERLVCADAPPTGESVAALGPLRLRVSADRTVTVAIGLRPGPAGEVQEGPGKG